MEQNLPQSDINVLNPEGDLVSIPSTHLNDALKVGYTQPSEQEIHDYQNEQKFGSTGQQLITGLEGAASAATFGASKGIERALGVNPEDIQGREETNPISHGAGQIAGLVGSSLALPGGGAAGLMDVAGGAAARGLGLGLEGAGAISKIGSSAVKMAVENAMFSSGDEVGKMLIGDPNQSVETAASNIGLNALIGGGIGGVVGTVSPLWKATFGSKTEGALNALIQKTNNGEIPLIEGTQEAIAKSGMELDPVLRAAYSEDPLVQKEFGLLRESKSDYGQKALNSINEFKDQASTQITDALGKTPSQIAELPSELSKFESGNKVRNSFVNELEQKIKPIEESYNEINEKFKNAIIPDNLKNELIEKIGQFSLENALHKSPSSPELGLVERIIKEIPLQETAQDLKKFISNNLNEFTPGNNNLNFIRRGLKSIIRNAEEGTVTNAIGEQAPELLAQHAQARTDYRKVMSLLDDVNDRVHVGRYDGPQSFMNAMKELKPEKIINSLTSKEDAGIFQTVLKEFPETLKNVQDFNLDKFLKPSAMSDGKIDISKLFQSMKGMTPEMKEFAFGQAAEKIDAIKQLWQSLPTRLNPSGSGGVGAALVKNMPAAAIGMISLIMGHNPAVAASLGYLTKLLGTEAPDAIRYATLKFLGSPGGVDAVGFKSMVNAIQATIKGENLLGKATKAIFKSGTEVIPQSLMPNETKRNKLDKTLLSYQEDPSKMLDVSNNSSSYMPDHAQSVGELTSRAVTYLNSLRPDLSPQGPLDKEREANPFQKSAFNRALDIAEQPLVVMEDIKNGTLTSSDLITLQTIYPSLYSKLTQQLTNQMINHVSKDNSIPYKTRIGLAMFMGQPLDSTMTPSSIQISQSIFQPNAVPPLPGNGNAGGKHNSLKNLNKLASQMATPQQSRLASHKF